jgi:hypothetical protein
MQRDCHMAIFDKHDYYAGRAQRERELAMISADPRAAAIHRELATRYAAISAAADVPIAQPAGEPPVVLCMTGRR